VADLQRTSLRLGVLLALAVVALFEVLGLLQGVRSARRLRTRVAHDVQGQVEKAWPRLRDALSPGGPPAWNEAASVAIGLDLATEVEVLDPKGPVLFSRPTVPPVAHALGAVERARVAGGRPVTAVVQSGPSARALTYVAFGDAGRVRILCLATRVGDLEDELRERRQVLLGHVASLGALLLAATLALLPGSEPGKAKTSPPAALHAYAQTAGLRRDAFLGEKFLNLTSRFFGYMNHGIFHKHLARRTQHKFRRG